MIPSEVLRRYAEPHRRYHTVRPLRAVLAALLIVATKKHRPLDGGNVMRLLLDADLWILGSPRRTHRLSLVSETSPS
ncbi:hypothetical protein [Armatimonas sp.]|uniref:hypothetical protein n=1 Tax=Armatimonas sp. TaxID=1872638 RepID=UPI003752FDE9